MVVVPVGGKLREMGLVLGLRRGLLIVEELLLDLLRFGGWDRRRSASRRAGRALGDP